MFGWYHNEHHSFFCNLSEGKGDSLILKYSNIDTTWTEPASPFPFPDDSITFEWKEHPCISWNASNISEPAQFTKKDDDYFTLLEASPCVDTGNPHQAYNDYEDPKNLGFALWPAQGTVRNDMGAYGGSSTLDRVPKIIDDNIVKIEAPEKNDIVTSYELYNNYPI